MLLSELLKNVEYELKGNVSLGTEIDHWSDDSRQIKSGSWFIAVRGELSDGHSFIPDLLRQGVSGVVVEKEISEDIPQVIVPSTKKTCALWADLWFDQPSKKMKIVGVTGTNGKTTTAYLIQKLLHKEENVGVIGTVEALWKQKHLPLMNTTPGIFQLNQILREMLEDGVKECAVEVSSHALKQNRIEGIDVDVAVFSNLTQDHLDYHQTMDDYFNSKQMLFTDFPSVAARVVNLDDSYGRRIWNNHPEKETFITYGIESKGVDLKANQIQSTLNGSSFVVVFKEKEYEVKTQLIAQHNIYNILAAIASCLSLGSEIDELIMNLEDFKGVPGRLEKMNHILGSHVFVDYAHTPDAFDQIFKAFLPLKKKRIISVFGCGGDRDTTKRPIMAQWASRGSDIVIITNDNPRNEDPENIIQDILKGVEKESSSEVEVIKDRKKAIVRALEISQSEDIILVLGKGHEDYQIIGNKKHHFSDQEVIQEWNQNCSVIK